MGNYTQFDEKEMALIKAVFDFNLPYELNKKMREIIDEHTANWSDDKVIEFLRKIGSDI